MTGAHCEPTLVSGLDDLVELTLLGGHDLITVAIDEGNPVPGNYTIRPRTATVIQS